MTKVEKALHWAYRYQRGECDFAGCPGDHDIGDTKIVVGHLLALGKEVERLRKVEAKYKRRVEMDKLSTNHAYEPLADSALMDVDGEP